jgi:hypothetical protein
MDEITKIIIQEFEKKPDGSWVAVKNTDINTESGRVIRITPGMTFKKGGKLWGLDVAKALDEISAK